MRQFNKIFELKNLEKDLFKIFNLNDTITFIKFKKEFIILIIKKEYY